MSRKGLLLAMLVATLVAGTVQADLVAIKRSPGLTVDVGLDATFKAAIAAGTLPVVTGQDKMKDAEIYAPSTTDHQTWRNYGINGSIGYGTKPILTWFDLSSLPNFQGGRIVKAQLRLYYEAGNTGLGKTGYLTTGPWDEGNKSAAFPGAAPAMSGASGAHPRGLNTNSNQNAAGGTTAPLFSWAGDTMFSTAKDVSAAFVGCTKTSYGAVVRPNGTDPSYDGWAVMDVTPFVQEWANGTPNYGFCTYDSGLNYTVFFSENTVGPDFQPVLLINYEQNAAPNGITNLAVVGTDWFKVDLRWTAPTDSPPGPASRYEVRYSNSPIDETNWDAATLCTCLVPNPAAPGTVENLTVKDLAPSTTYYFAIKCFDITNLVSPISNLVSATTLPTDAVAPAQITSLATPNVKPNYAVLTWTAVGDDGVTGVAADYDLRYSTSPIDAANFDSATRIAGLAAPKVAGSAETFTIHGLTPSTTYYFAIKAGDEVPNFGAISNVLVVTTLAEDLLAPNAVTDLKMSAAHIRTAYLSWTAPADAGSAGLSGYDLRYSTSPIDASNFDAASQVAGEPTPAAPGVKENFAVTGLNPDTTYYFAIKSFDWAEPANLSNISNTATGKTMPPVLPITIKNPWLTNDRVADTHNLQSMGATYVKAYTPDGVILPADDEAKAINIYNNQKRRLYHWADEPPNGLGTTIDDPTYTQNVFGWCLCGRHAAQACTIVQAAGLTPRKIGLPGHWVYEVQYTDGTWHFYDTMTTCYVYNKANPRKVASCDQIKADTTLLASAVADGRACPGFLLCGDTVSWFQGAINSWSSSGSGVTTAKWTGNMDLRIGEAFSRTWESWANQYPTARTNSDGAAGNDSPYHHEANKDWKDTVNLPYWEPYQLTAAQNSTVNIPMTPTYRRWSNGTYVLAPDFTSQAYQAALDSTSAGIATYNDDGLTPNLHAAAANTTGNAIFKIALPYYLTDATISGSFYRKTAGDVCKIYVSTTGTAWTNVWTHSAIGTSELTNLSLRTNVLGQWTYWVKVEFKGVAAKTDAGADSLVINTTFEHNKGAMAYLDKGANNITVTFDNPQDLASGRAAFKVTYKWKEYDGSGWNVDKSYEQYVTASPTTFSINVGGTKVPRTEYIKLEVTEPPAPDSYAPDAVNNLAVALTESAKVTLNWTSTGDDGMIGQATSYDLRYSTSPIVDDDAFAVATQATGVPAPKTAGGAETFVVRGLTPDTNYWFAVKVKDEGGNLSLLSNVVFTRTLPPDLTAPAFVTDLLAKSSKTAGAIDLTWTAVGNDGFTGTAASYDLRYSTSPIDESNFAAATLVNLPAPKAAGAAESFQVTGLVGGTYYYFAIKAADEAPNTSEISNVAEAKASVIGEKTLQVGLDGYIGCTDTYTFVGTATTNYGGIERMTVTGYGAGNYQRGYLKFDMASIPAGATVTSATLSVYAYDPAQSKGSSGNYGVYPITRTWNDMQASWNNATTSVAWTTPGGDFAAVADATALKQPPASTPLWYAFDVTSRVQAWLTAPASNFGWCLKVVNEAQSVQDRFYQSDTANATLRPKLVISDLSVPVAGDINGDATVDVLDLLTLAGSWGYVYGDRGYDPRCDLSPDQAIDVLDLLTLAEHWPQ